MAHPLTPEICEYPLAFVTCLLDPVYCHILNDLSWWHVWVKRVSSLYVWFFFLIPPFPFWLCSFSWLFVKLLSHVYLILFFVAYSIILADDMSGCKESFKLECWIFFPDSSVSFPALFLFLILCKSLETHCQGFFDKNGTHVLGFLLKN